MGSEQFEGNKDEQVANIAINCADAAELYESLKHSAGHHRTYRIYYKSIEIVEQIIKNKNLILRNDNFNDCEEKDSLTDSSIDGFVKFILCLTYSLSESVAMWYMYGDNLESNVMVKYNTLIKDIVKYNENSPIEFGFFDSDNKTFEKKGETSNCEITIVDVLYCEQNDNGTYYIKRAEKSKKNVPKEVVESLPKHICKNNAWNYENECRLVVKVPKEIVNGVNAVRLKLSDDITKSLIKDGIIVKSPSFIDQNSREYRMVDSKLKGKVVFPNCENI